MPSPNSFSTEKLTGLAHSRFPIWRPQSTASKALSHFLSTWRSRDTPGYPSRKQIPNSFNRSGRLAFATHNARASIFPPSLEIWITRRTAISVGSHWTIRATTAGFVLVRLATSIPDTPAKRSLYVFRQHIISIWSNSSGSVMVALASRIAGCNVNGSIHFAAA